MERVLCVSLSVCVFAILAKYSHYIIALDCSRVHFGQPAISLTHWQTSPLVPWLSSLLHTYILQCTLRLRPQQTNKCLTLKSMPWFFPRTKRRWGRQLGRQRPNKIPVSQIEFLLTLHNFVGLHIECVFGLTPLE